MKKCLKMKNALKKRLGKWKVGDYVRQFSIVTGGVLLTLWLTAKIADSSKQKEVRQAMQLVTLELRENLRFIRDYEWLYNQEKRAAQRLREHDFSLAGFPADTVETYWRHITNGMGKPYRFMTDALEMLKTTGIASHIADKQIVIDLLRSYNDIGEFDNSMELYYTQRSKTLVPHQMGENHLSGDNIGLHEEFAGILSEKTVQGWLRAIPRAYDADYFARCAEKVEKMIAELEKRYK